MTLKMTALLLSRATILGRHRIGNRSCAHSSMVGRKLFSSSSAAATTAGDGGSTPLFLSLPETPYDEKPPRILFPPNIPIVFVSSITDISNAVEQHYDLTATTLGNGGGQQQQQFVGGMGESDGGVWFIPTVNDSDPMHHYTELIEPSIELVKQSRHGVPFGVYTSGTVSINDPTRLKESFATVHVSLLAANPMDYCEASGVFREEMFGEVCNFLVAAEEVGIPIHVGVLKKYASHGRDLAMALGAQHVDVYND